MQKNYTSMFKLNEVDKFKYKCSKFFLILCLFIFTTMIYFNLTYSIAPVSGLSMYPTLNDSSEYSFNTHYDRVVLNYLKNFHYSDIIIAKKSSASNETYKYVIKRLIAMGGDSVEILSDGTVLVNNEVIDESYVTSNNKEETYINFMEYKNTDPKIDGKEIFEGNVLKIPKGYVYYLGDNRGNSYDCSVYGPVKETEIIAKVDFIIKDGENTFISILKQIFGIK